jgi:hypothetical protein
MILSTIPAAKVGAALLATLATVGSGVAVEHAVSGPSTAAEHRAAPTGAPTQRGVGPDVQGPAGFGLCNAYTHGGLPATSVPYRNLVAAAGGASKIAAFCAKVPHPGKASDHPGGKPTTHPAGKPTTHPAGKPSEHPGGPQSTHPSGKPSETPSPNETPSAEPSASPSASSSATTTS